MSSIYHTEPPTQGKVVVHTNHGDIDIELWPKEAPLACRNFVQLALEGYFDSTTVHRAIKGFMIQMGDPTGTGTGGQSIWGKPFKDEIHGRIKFNHRGQVAMANANKPNSNQSQFFVTLDACDWLNGKHTIFGKVTGSTIFNAIRMGDVEVTAEDHPIDPIRLLSVEVLSNPFDDIVPRVSKPVAETTASASSKPRDSHFKAVKNTQLLSFNDPEEEMGDGDADALKVKFRSVHDLKKKSNHSRRGEERAAVTSAAAKGDGDDGPYNSDLDQQLQEDILKKNVEKLKKQSKSIEKSLSQQQSTRGKHSDSDDDEIVLPSDKDAWAQQIRDDERSEQMQQRSAEFLQARAELLRSRRAVNVLTGAEAAQVREETAYREMTTPLEQRRMKYAKRKSEFGDRSEDTLAKLKKFTEGMRSKKSALKASAPANSSPQGETYRGQVLEHSDDDATKEEMDDWFVGKLKCKKHIDQQYRNADMGADNRRGDDYVVMDTRQSRE